MPWVQVRKNNLKSRRSCRWQRLRPKRFVHSCFFLQVRNLYRVQQQEEADKKAARLKEMESRRQLALQRKAEEEKAKALEEDRKMKEETERRKREREEHTDKRPLKPSVTKKVRSTCALSKAIFDWLWLRMRRRKRSGKSKSIRNMRSRNRD